MLQILIRKRILETLLGEKNAPGIASRTSTDNDVPVIGPVYLLRPQKPRFPTAILQLFVESARFNLVTRKSR